MNSSLAWLVALVTVTAGLYVFVRAMVPVMRVLLTIALFLVGLGSALALLAFALSPEPVRDLVLEIAFGP